MMELQSILGVEIFNTQYNSIDIEMYSDDFDKLLRDYQDEYKEILVFKIVDGSKIALRSSSIDCISSYNIADGAIEGDFVHDNYE